MSHSFTAIVPERLDIFLARESGITRGRVQKAIEEGLVTVNGKTTTKIALKLKEGDMVEMKEETHMDDGSIKPVDLKLSVLHEDDACFVIEKPAGIAVHPGAGMEPGEITILHGVAFLFKKKKLPFSANSVLVHRLDKDTTGCLLVAKTREAHAALQKQFELRTVKKFYLALVSGVPAMRKAMIDADIGRSASNKTKMGINRVSAARDAKTSYTILASSNNASLLLCELHTGRTHQIRVHLTSIGHPLLGDDKYINRTSELLSEEYGITAMCLHAYEVEFTSPAKEKRCRVRSEIPAPFQKTMEELGIQYVTV